MSESKFAAQVMEYWRRHGYSVKVHFSARGDLPGEPGGFVRSGLVNGLPRGLSAKDARDLAFSASARTGGHGRSDRVVYKVMGLAS